ncbi:hypothetical protein GRAN_2108 [Granulicella sibirica]|uniref:Uncharacterized protein n=1 Tax=Granulicella sibirica TaxID=2479048 RepID=A0A4Q0T9K7_9BACT|nr:hypothetical protein GRAN_2108 [Granulicella sibirica]
MNWGDTGHTRHVQRLSLLPARCRSLLSSFALIHRRSPQSIRLTHKGSLARSRPRQRKEAQEGSLTAQPQSRFGWRKIASERFEARQVVQVERAADVPL